MELTLNKNFYNYLGFVLFGGIFQSTEGGAVIGTAYSKGYGYYVNAGTQIPCPLDDITGYHRDTIYPALTSSNQLNNTINHTFFNFNANGGVVFTAGSGNTEATINDTALVTPNSNITATIETGKRDTTTSIVYTVTFSASTEQTLNEIGLQRNVSIGMNDNLTVMFARGVFDTPITLDADHSLTLQIRLALPIPA